MLNYREILIRYMMGIINQETISFLQYFSSEFQPEEEAVLNEIEAEARRRLDYGAAR